VSTLAARLEDLPGVASATVDVTEAGGGIDVRLEPGADEPAVVEEVRALLIAYGVRSSGARRLRLRHRPGRAERPSVDVKVAPEGAGARVELTVGAVRSARVVAATPSAVAQGLADAWCQTLGKAPVDIAGVSMADDGTLSVSAFDGGAEKSGEASVSEGLGRALTQAVGRALGAIGDSGAAAPAPAKR